MSTSAGFKAYIDPETSTWGSLAGSPDWKMLPIEPTSGVDIVETLFDDARRGQAVVGFRQLEGVHRTELSISGPAFQDEIGHLLRSILGEDTFTSAVSGTSPAKHIFDVESMATAAGHSFQLQFQDDALTGGDVSYTHEGLIATQMTFRFNSSEGLLTYEANIMGKGMVLDTAASSVADATEDPVRGWHSDVTVSASLGTATSGRLIEGEISIARDADLVYVANNNRFPVKIIPGLVAVTGRFTTSYDLSTNLGPYRNVTNESVIIELTYGAADAMRSVDFEFPKLSYTDSPAEIDRSGNNMTIAYNFRGLEGTTSTILHSTSPKTNIRVRLQNATDSDYVAAS